MSILQIDTPRWFLPLLKPARYKGIWGGRGCVHPDTLIDIPSGQVKVSEFTGGLVWSWDNGKRVVAHATAAYPCTIEDLYEVELDDGRSIIVTDEHKFLTPNGWRMLSALAPGDAVLAQLLESDDNFITCKIDSVQQHSRQTYWDLHVYGTNNYLSNGIVNHNSGKSHAVAEYIIERCIMERCDVVCIREVQKSLQQSVKRLLELKIEALGVEDYFEIQHDRIKTKHGGVIIFTGMSNHTADSIKSLESFDIAWFEEAQTCSQRSLDLLRPTMRKETSELIFTWNPHLESDPIDVLLRSDNPPPNSTIVRVNYSDNPWFPSVLREEMQYDMKRDMEKYQHVWLGEYIKNSESRVFKNWWVEEFETPEDVALRFGADWGFAVDPTVLVRCFISGKNLYIDYEAYMVGCEITNTPELFMTVPESERWPIVADNARPETISYMRSHGFPKIMPAVKGPKSLEEGIEWLKSFDIIVHPRCVHTIDELTMYSYKTDNLTGQVLPILDDKDNHVIDALRYACESARRAQKQKPTNVAPIATLNRW